MKNIIFNKTKKTCKTIALVLVFAMVINLCSCAAKPDKQEAAQPAVDNSAYAEVVYNDAEKLAAKLQTGVAELKKQVDNSGKKVSKNVSQKADELATLLDTYQQNMDKFFAENREKIASLKSDTLNQRQEAYETMYAEKTAAAKETLADLAGATNTKETKKSLKTLQSLWGEEETPIYGTEPVNVAEEAEITTEEVESLEEYAESMTENSVKSSDKRGAKGEYLELSGETALTDNIKAKAEELATPLNVYNYLKTTIDYELYLGSRKGAGETLDAQAGNDKDQASLLITMLRYLGYPARYVEGTIELDSAQVKNLTGAKDIESGANVLASAGVPITLLSADGKVAAVSLNHTWVEAYVPYTDYRGAGKNTGESRWIPLDTGISQYEEVESVASYLEDKDITVNWNTLLENGDSETIIAQMEQMKERIVGEQSEGSSNLYTRNRIKSSTTVSYLPLSLQYMVLTKKEIYATIKEADSDRVTFTIDGKKLGTYKYAELAGKRITIDYEAETEDDKKALETYGSVFDTPAYLVSMKPVLKFDGEIVAAGNAVILGTTQTLSMKITSCGMENAVNNSVTAGSLYQVTLDGQAITGNDLLSSYEEAVALAESATVESVYSDDYLGKVLDVAGKLYFAQLDAANTIASEMCGVKATRSLSEGMTGYQVRTSSLYGSPVAVSEGSLFIDIDHDSHGVVSLSGSKADEVKFMKVSGMLSSLCENLIWEELTGAESVSTMTVLQTATEQDMELLVINESNYEEMSEKLEADNAVLTDIKKAVKSGKEVTVPTREVTMGDWTGTGYIIMDSETGAGAYRISGGLSNGTTGNLNGGSVTGLVTTEAILGITLLLVDIVELVSCLVSIACMSVIPGGMMVALVIEMVLLTVAVIELVQYIQLYVRFLNGDLEAGEQVVTETMVNASFSIIFSSITWIVKKCGNAVRTKWKESKLQKKMKELFGEAADDVDDDFDIIDDYEDAATGGDSGNSSGKGGTSEDGDKGNSSGDDSGNGSAAGGSARTGGDGSGSGSDAGGSDAGGSGSSGGSGSGDISIGTTTSYKDYKINLSIVEGKVNGQIPVDEYKLIRGRSLQNENSTTMTLGKYLVDESGNVLPEAYTEMAKKYGDAYFDLGNEWGVVKEIYGITDKDMFELFNKPALDYAVESGKTIRFSQDPRLKMYEDDAIADEWRYLMEKYGYIELKKEGEFWYAIK